VEDTTAHTTLLRSLKFILDRYFGNITYQTMQTIVAREESFSLEHAETIAEELGLISQREKVNLAALPTFLLPVILYKNSDEAVVLINVHKNDYLIYDPKKNEQRVVSKKELARYKNAFFLFKDESDKAILLDKKRQPNSWFWAPIKASWRSYIEVLFLTLFINLFVLAIPIYTRNVYDKVVPNFALETLIVLTVGVVVILLFDLIFKAARIYIIEKVGKQVSDKLEEDLMRKILFAYERYDTMQSGTKMNLFRELTHIREFITSKSLVQILDFPFFFLFVWIIYLISPAVALVPIVSAVLILIVNFFFNIPISNMAHKLYEDRQAKHNYILESIEGTKDIKLTNTPYSRLHEWRKVIGFFNDNIKKSNFLTHLSQNISVGVVQGVTLFVLLVGVFQIHEKSITVGGLIAVTILAARAMGPVVSFSAIVLHYREFKEALHSLDTFWANPTELSGQNQVGIEQIDGKVEFDRVNFAYPKSGKLTLENISFTIQPGEKVAIIGPTGAGKSTMLKLLSGLEQPTSGNIYIDAHNISSIHPVELRNAIGMMGQESYLFHGTISENIELSRKLPKEKLLQTIEDSGLIGFVRETEEGIAQHVGENGSNISTGQKQLISLARALANDPSIVILDEPTSGLDMSLEQKVVSQLKETLKEKTVIVVTHRFVPLQMVDRVILLNENKVIADGPRDEVMKKLQSKKG
jgi:ATP-binding cassette subfamily B protein/ATP-binding cassette subfamily C protein LapB